jgi:histidyl-tRNA synthetase
MEELNLFPTEVNTASKVLFLNMGDQEMSYAMQAVVGLRDAGIKTEIYPDKAKVGKQFQFADKKGIPFAVLVGSQEIEEGKFTLKELVSGEQTVLDLQELIKKLK